MALPSLSQLALREQALAHTGAGAGMNKRNREGEDDSSFEALVEHVKEHYGKDTFEVYRAISNGTSYFKGRALQQGEYERAMQMAGKGNGVDGDEPERGVVVMDVKVFEALVEHLKEHYGKDTLEIFRGNGVTYFQGKDVPEHEWKRAMQMAGRGNEPDVPLHMPVYDRPDRGDGDGVETENERKLREREAQADWANENVEQYREGTTNWEELVELLKRNPPDQ